MNTQTHRVLIVDDDPDIRANLSDIFADVGFEVEAAEDGYAALKVAARNPVDVALLDLKMPGMNGFEVYRRLKLIDPGIATVVVTAYASSDEAKAVLQAGACGILAKPVDLNKLMPLVESALAQPTIIVVDDDRELCRSIWNLLRDNGCRVCLAFDAEEAVRMIAQRSFDVALVDLQLGKGDADDVLAALRQMAPETVAVVIADSAGGSGSRKASSARGIDHVVSKPIDLPNMLRIIQSARSGELAAAEPSKRDRKDA